MIKFGTEYYRQFLPRVSGLKGNSILTRSGVVLFDWRWTFLSIYQNPIVVVRTLLVALASVATRKTENLDDGRRFGLVHSIWSAGYYHWITESLPRALALQQSFPDAIPLLPSSRYAPYVRTLHAIGFDAVAFFPEGKNVRVQAPIVTECPRQFGTTAPSALIAVRDRVWKFANPNPTRKRSKIVYVSRKMARGRYVLNEAEVISALKLLGAEVVCFEALSFVEQVLLMLETDTLVSIHGAALTNMLFMPPGGLIVEMVPKKNGIFDYNIVRNSLRHDPCYLRLAQALNHNYRSIECSADNKWYRSTHMANISIEVEHLVRMIKSREIS